MCDEHRKYRNQTTGVPTGVPAGNLAYGHAAQQGRGYNRLEDAAGEGPMQNAVDVAYRPTIRERLLKERHSLAERLSAVQQAIAALDANPEFEKHDATRAALKAAGVYFD
jgi:hypothetical protein